MGRMTPARLTRLADPTMVAVIVVGVMAGTVLLGWALGADVLRSGWPRTVAVKPNTAIAFLWSALALALLSPPSVSRRHRRAGRSLAAAAGTLGALSLAEYIGGIDLGVDQLLFSETPGAVGTSNLGRMAPNTALNFMLLAGALFCLHPRRDWQSWAMVALGLLVAVLAAVALIGYLSGVTSLYAVSNVTQMAIPTAIAFLVLVAGMCCARPERGPLRLVNSDTAGGTVIRVVFPATVALPLLLGVLRLIGHNARLYDADTGTWLMVLAMMFLLVPLTWVLAASLDRSECALRRSRVMRQEAQRERVAFEEAPIGSVLTTPDGTIQRVNGAMCEIIGYRADELLGHCIYDFTHGEDQQLTRATVRGLLDGEVGTFRIDKRYRHRDGHVVDAHVAITAILDEDGRVGQLFGQVQDISDARRAADDLQHAQLETLARLGAAAEFRDDDTGQHTRRVGDLSAAIAERLGLPAATVALLRMAAPLHDVGKIAIPDAVLLKPGRLTSDELNQMKAHTTVGARMLSGGAFPLLEMAEQIALTHHERWDGSGYPAGLSGEGIPLVGRIVAVADVFDALTHARPYKNAWTASKAIAEMRRQSGRQFDPTVLAAFLELRYPTTPTDARRPRHAPLVTSAA
ncbi:PAS domain S-box protein [Baekduia soli]|uniref:PAS domain S-box protein n=1 Tax=Baekduia soli TaxID=496014 RepID=A0A5B8U6U9_9ACTN|nr:HD domain-containing phosphohydrolase [Baekduia soli]QEC48568.1 PAS domain S-box protein [Baekduia soli]